jgi:hypothetical protein
MPTREAVMTALQSMLAGLGSFAIVSRRNRSPETIGPSQSPALFLLEHSEDYHTSAVNLPPVRSLTVSVVIYNDVGPNNDAIPSTVVNQMLDAIDAALAARDPGTGRYTLGGLVYSVVAEGAVEKAPGDKTGKSLAIVPLKIILP